MSGTEPTVPGYPPLVPPRRRRGVPLAAVLVVLIVVVVGVSTGLASHWAKGYFLFSPGTAPLITTSSRCRPSGAELSLPGGAPCVRLVVPQAKAHPVNGKLLMVDVEVSTPGPLDWAEYSLGLLGKQRQFVPVADYAGQTPTSELSCQDAQQMASADQDAALAALKQLHYRVEERALGAQVTAVLAGTPAWHAGVQCDDLITAVNGKKVADAGSFSALLSPFAPGSEVELTDVPASGGSPKKVRVRLAKPPASVVAQGFANRAYLGVEVQTKLRPELPFKVSVDAGDIGGPSAGLAFTLAILDSLSDGELTGGHVVAATGTITPDGAVGDVGGVQEKAVAVEKAGAQVFFVPQAEYAAAVSVVGKKLQVVPVTTLAQVLGTLKQHFGGSLASVVVGTSAHGT